jgi:hypothetical protein
MTVKEIRDNQAEQVRHELYLHLIKLLQNFKSKEVPHYRGLTKDDVIWVLTRRLNGYK